MVRIPKQEKKKVKRIVPDNIKQDTEKKKVLFSFESLESFLYTLNRSRD